nr:MAG: hypothetical protein BECKTUN1418D_GA0071000_111811 [Candidatus Kentron sp. TUN]
MYHGRLDRPSRSERERPRPRHQGNGDGLRRFRLRWADTNALFRMPGEVAKQAVKNDAYVIGMRLRLQLAGVFFQGPAHGSAAGWEVTGENKCNWLKRINNNLSLR